MILTSSLNFLYYECKIYRQMKSLVIKDRRGLNFKTKMPKSRYNKGKTVCYETHTTLQPRLAMQEMYSHIIKGFARINIHKSS